MDEAVEHVSRGPDFRAGKASIGFLAILAAAAAGTGMMISASLFGALAALALSAGAVLSALLEFATSDRERAWRSIAWAGLAPGWIVFAAMLLHAPLSHLDALRILATALLAGATALRVWRWRAEPELAGGGALLGSIFSMAALGAVWSSGLQLGDTPITAIGTGAAIELCGAGSVLVAGASLRRATRRAKIEPTAVTPRRVQIA